MRKVMAAGLVLAGIGAFVGVTAWMARPVAAQAVAAPGQAVGTFIAGGSRVGATVRDVTPEDQAGAGLAEARGVVVASVAEDGPAAEAGLQPGDIVLEFDGERVRSVRQFTRLVQDTPAGRAVDAAVLRDGARQVLTVTPRSARAAVDLALPAIRRDLERSLRDLPRAFEDFDFDFDARGFFAGPRTRLGVGLTPLGDQLAEFFGVDGGVLVSSVEDGSSARQAGLRAGDVITAIDGDAVRDVADVREALIEAGAGATVALAIVREGDAMTLMATLPGEARTAGTGV